VPRIRNSLKSMALAAFGLGAAACSGGDGDAGSIRESTLTVSLMDAPVDEVTAVKVQVAAIWLKAPDGPARQLALRSTPMTVDLLGLDDRNAALLIDDAPLEAGRYEWLAMDVNADFDGVMDSYVLTKVGGQEEIRVPSGRVRLVSGFEVAANQAVELLFDWSLRKGLVDPPGQPGFLLKPAFRVIDVTELGELRGTVAMATIVATGDPNGCATDHADLAVGNEVYVYSGANVTPDDVDEVDPEPVVIVPVAQDAAGDYVYRTILQPGTYTIAFTCQAGNDDPEIDDSGTPNEIDFVAPVTRDATADAALVVDF
jgi:hypothetical protein